MLLMALDHTRDYFTNLSFDPENLDRTSVALFFTRWVTHFCAPLFFFLAGTGGFLYGIRHGLADLRRFLWTRGLWLIILEFTLVGTAWTFIFPWGFCGVIWCLGCSMILLSFWIRLPMRWIAGTSAALILFHDLLDPIRPSKFGPLGWIWSMLHVKGPIRVFGCQNFVLFPIVPWCAVMALGYAFGPLLRTSSGPKWIFRIGLAMTVLFVILRVTNVYGNPRALPGGVTPGAWSIQPTHAKTVILFLDTEKYPPSLQFLLMTLGPSLIVLSGLQVQPPGRIGQRIAVFGRVPLFYYVLHLYLIHTMAVVAAALYGQPVKWLLRGAFWLQQPPSGYGHDLLFVWAMWILSIALMYFPCRWFAELKAGRRTRLLRYL